jgi:hypothetical protein
LAAEVNDIETFPRVRAAVPPRLGRLMGAKCGDPGADGMKAKGGLTAAPSPLIRG